MQSRTCITSGIFLEIHGIARLIGLDPGMLSGNVSACAGFRSVNKDRLSRNSAPIYALTTQWNEAHKPAGNNSIQLIKNLDLNLENVNVSGLMEILLDVADGANRLLVLSSHRRVIFLFWFITMTRPSLKPSVSMPWFPLICLVSFITSALVTYILEGGTRELPTHHSVMTRLTLGLLTPFTFYIGADG
ncbi:hypothetical protein SeMB42_g03601 [Synchytrium endobioticum]|uniref:Uncharacterized protein n=1 Tax=Synchytrium endobioticum TaxID=286115 RepID=A0A507D5H9_9FUNG|nr:hypothetical protein SeMB42_g03601 [Synchytrium endobioticum]TPX49573.1 hypothetical protein SeLEV6574_g01397 [Synchytrium endobioticum]